MQAVQLMNLKDLHSSLERHKIVVKPDTTIQQDIDPQIACNVVDHIFRYIDVCIKEDKSKKKLSLFAKSFIRGILTDNLRNEINNFILNMNDTDVKSMLDELQKELDKRRLEGR